METRWRINPKSWCHRAGEDPERLFVIIVIVPCLFPLPKAILDCSGEHAQRCFQLSSEQLSPLNGIVVTRWKAGRQLVVQFVVQPAVTIALIFAADLRHPQCGPVVVQQPRPIFIAEIDTEQSSL